MVLYQILALGDFDSVTERRVEDNSRKCSKVISFSSEKDETDLELAIDWAITKNQVISIYLGQQEGEWIIFSAIFNFCKKNKSSGNRRNQTFISWMSKNSLTVKTPGSYIIEVDDQKVFFFSVSAKWVTGTTLSGFKYPLEQSSLTSGSTLCISNELISDCGNVSFAKGILMVVRSND